MNAQIPGARVVPFSVIAIACRAKGIESVRRCLAEAGKLDTQTLERDRHDLAGARLIFYTNNDVDRFLASPLIYEHLIYEHFEIEEKNQGHDTAQSTTQSGSVTIA